MRLLLDAGARLDAPNAYDVTPAQLAARLGVELSVSLTSTHSSDATATATANDSGNGNAK